MTEVLLIRHGDTDSVGAWLAGWLEGVALNARGRAQAERLAARLETLPLRALYSSPLERTRETARAIAARHRLEIHLRPELGEIRFGEWTGRRFDELASDPRWEAWHRCRTAVRPPGGERIAEVQARMLAGLEEIGARHPDELIAVVSHADPIKAVLAHWLGMPLDLIDRFEVSPASIQVLDLRPPAPVVRRVNDVGHLDDLG
jgi:probable phosphomutase (TIGR03848 family)